MSHYHTFAKVIRLYNKIHGKSKEDYDSIFGIEVNLFYLMSRRLARILGGIASKLDRGIVKKYSSTHFPNSICDGFHL
eukprot:snap_masked-scaffold_1-processed-gene-4.43-mRNA-1 protein AED:1.00 eAED:1.00 QI:0/0/0/0/1/1/2/0/77